jgi:CRP-like cAMP-binding protein
MAKFGNHFLDGLLPRDLAVLEPHLRKVILTQNQILAKTGEPVVRSILPVNGIISVILEMQDGRQIETRTIGCESGYGLLHVLGASTSYETVTTQIGGEAFVIDQRAFATQARQSAALMENIVRHGQATIVQSAQAVACNALHDVKQRLARWLLMTQDRVSDDELPLTQQHLSVMLAVQRTTVTAAASELQREGAIAYRRGRITVVDRALLMKRSCECYEAIESGVKQLFAAPSAGALPGIH